MIRKISIILAVLVSLAWMASAWAELKEGLWEMTTQVEMKGMPAGMPAHMPATTVKQCITKKDPVPQASKKEKGQECRITDQKVVGDTVTYTMECKGKDSLVVTSGKMTYKGNTFEGASTTSIKNKGQKEMQMSNRMTGKYIGPCPK
jgi:hypothetical protein